MGLGGRSLLASVWLACAAAGQTPVISTVAGTTRPGGEPVRGFSGDGGPATFATLALANLQNECDPLQFEQTSHIATDAAGNVYIADSNNHRIRRISTDGVITTIAGSGERPQTNTRCEPTSPTGDGGQAREARLYNPSDMVVLKNGNLIIADQQNNRIRQVTPSGVITTVAGNGTHNLYAPGVPATSSPLDWPGALAVDDSGTLYFAELHGNRVAKVGADGRLATVAGNGFPGYTGDNIPATSAPLRKPAGIAVDAGGNVYIADTGNHRVRKVSTDGIIRTIAGTGQAGFSGDGVADRVMLNTPMDVKVNSAGNVYIADTGNHRVRMITPDGMLRTLAGTGEAGRGVDLVGAASSALNYPSALALGPNGDLYIADWQNFLVRKVSFSGNPALTPGGVVNSATFTDPVAPGSIISLFGANLSSVSAQAPDAWPARLEDVAVQVNGSPIPMYFVSPAQVIGQLPYETPAGTSMAMVSSGGHSSNSVEFRVESAAPRIFKLGASRAAALNQDGVTVNSPTSAEARGNVVTVFLTGIGGVDPPVATGQSASAAVLSRAKASVSAMVGQVSAEVLFIGLTPGSIGLAQANIRIPESVIPGPDVPVVLQLGVTPSNVAAIAVR